MPRIKRPRRGSLQFWPRKRAKRIYPVTKSWPEIKDLKPLGFAGWKAGMTHVTVTENDSNSPNYGKTVVKAATILDVAPLLVCGIRFYKGKPKTVSGEIWMEKLSEGIVKKTGNKKGSETEKFDNISLIVATQPEKGAMRKTKAEVFELAIGGDKKLEYAKSVLGKEIRAADVFRPGEWVDVSGVTKGSGYQGPVKRYGIRIQGRKDEQRHRKVGSIGATVPRKVDYRVPQAGQFGFFRRTEYNKKVLLIGDDAKKVIPKGGFLGYGNPNSYMIIEGSVPGPTKRLIRVRKAMRNPGKTIPIEVRAISLESRQ